MIDFPYLADVVQKTDSRIVMLVVDGLGGLPDPKTGRSELESACTPNLDSLAQESACGLTTPVMTGITPGSGPGHLALFGYDPLNYFIGRGVLEALGIGVDIIEGDVAARGNFCTVDERGLLTDRRAGRIVSAESNALCMALDQIHVDGVELSVSLVKDYRFVLMLRGAGLDHRVSETDPQRLGMRPLSVYPLAEAAQRSADVSNAFMAEAEQILSGRDKANMVLLRGFSQLPKLPTMGNSYGLSPAAIAAYPMYRGLASVVGMRVIQTGDTFADEVNSLETHYEQHDFFYIHYKPADAAGEDGDFDGKVRSLEDLDQFIPQILDLKPEVLIVAGDHATPSIWAGHSWHPVPFLLHSPWTRGDGVKCFSERACALGSLGNMMATHIMLLAMAHAGKLVKFGP